MTTIEKQEQKSEPNQAINSKLQVQPIDRLEEYRELMTVVPEWAEGLPVNATGGVYQRFRK